MKLISGDSLGNARNMEERLMNLGTIYPRTEVKLIKKDGSETIVQLASSLMYSNGCPVAVQHIARDVTKEKRMQENLQFFIQQITKAQEEERKRIAHDLHDDTVQSMIVHAREIEKLNLNINQLTKEEISVRLRALYKGVNTIIDEVRRLSQDLLPATLARTGFATGVRMDV